MHRRVAPAIARSGFTAILVALSATMGTWRFAGADDGAATVIRQVVEAARHPWLRWPRFPDYQQWVRDAYGPQAFQPLWISGGAPSPQALEIIAFLPTADARGLSAADYDAERLQAEAEQLARRSATAPEIGWFDTALTVSLMRFISDSYIGKIHPRLVGFGLDIEPKKLDLGQVVRELAEDDAPAQRLTSLDVQFPVYAFLQQALGKYRALAERRDLADLPALPKLRPGDSDPGMPAVRGHLAAYGDLPADTTAPADAALYDDTLAEAVRRFQRRHGLDPDAVIGPATLRALQVPPRARARQIELAMERLRWLPYRFPDRFVLVNIPEFRLRGFEAGTSGPAVSMEVVVGSAARQHETPVLHSEMTYLVFRPYWYVPRSIQRQEILPAVERDPGYLVRQNMELVDGRVRQKPGPNNALGLLKFIFPNRHHIYLHDTPSKALFARRRRDFSHGCIRVADPPALAEFVLDGQGGWDRTRIEQAMQRGPSNRRLNIETPVPVYVIYTTVVVDERGDVNFFDDIYQQDAALERLLAKGYPYPH